MQNLISVVIPAYNHEKYVQETIQSIINQTYQNIELIIIDDGSKDSTWQKIQEMKQVCENRFFRVLFETQENKGTCRTLNRLLELTQGGYVYIIASDDIAKPDAIEKEYNFLSKNSDYALCVGDDEIIDSESKVCYWDCEQNIQYDKEKAKYLSFGDFLQKNHNFSFLSDKFGRYDELYLGNHVINGYLIRKSIFDKIGQFTPDAPLEDYWLMLQISKYAKMKYLDEILFSYRWHNTNTVKNIEKMINLTNKTKEYEDCLLQNLDFNTVLPIVKEVFKYGTCYKKKGIPFIFEILTYRKKQEKIKIIKLFNVKIMSYVKNKTQNTK